MSKLFLNKENLIGLIDVGASGGLEREWKHLTPHMKVVGFEPDQNAYNILSKEKNANKIYINSAVSHSKGVKTLFLRKSQGNTSFYQSNLEVTKNLPYNDRFEIVGKTSVNTDTLDNLLQSNNISGMDFLKNRR